jgi:protein involved in polysaccharide export with SLBB domain
MRLIFKPLNWGVFARGLLIAGIFLTGCSSSPIDPVFSDNPVPATGDSPAEMNPGANVARFHVGDTVTVALTGLPYIGHVQAAGKTAGEVQNEIYNLYVPKIYRHVTVTVNTGDRVYYVTGEVKQPGRQLYTGQMTVTKAISTCGDFTDFANHKKVWLIRASGQRIKVNCDKAIQDASQDPQVYPNDQIQVPRRIW